MNKNQKQKQKQKNNIEIKYSRVVIRNVAELSCPDSGLERQKKIIAKLLFDFKMI